MNHKPAVLFDTNILIDELRGIAAAKQVLLEYPDRAISIVTWMEVMAGVAPPDKSRLRTFLQAFRVIALDQNIAELAANLRYEYRVKLPDAVIWATASVHRRVLVTRDQKGPGGHADVSVLNPYHL